MWEDDAGTDAAVAWGKRLAAVDGAAVGENGENCENDVTAVDESSHSLYTFSRMLVAQPAPTLATGGAIAAYRATPEV